MIVTKISFYEKKWSNTKKFGINIILMQMLENVQGIPDVIYVFIY